MNHPNPFSAQTVEHIRASLRPFDPAILADSQEQKNWLDNFGLNRRPVSMGTTIAGDYEIAVYYHHAVHAKATLLFIPGFLDHSAVHQKMINFCLENRISVLACDLIGHGFSSGNRGTISDFRHYGIMAKAMVDLYEQHNLPGDLHVLGHSTGGSSILELLRTEGKIWNGETLLIAPLIRSPLWRLSTAGTILADRTKIKTTPRVFQRTSHDQSFLKFLRSEPHRIETFVVEWSSSLTNWVPQIESMEPSPEPLTVIQGTDDFTVGWRTNLKTLERLFPNMDCTVIPAGRHHLLNESEPYSSPVYEKIREKICGGIR